MEQEEQKLGLCNFSENILSIFQFKVATAIRQFGQVPVSVPFSHYF
jgi:hypothetical protein